MEENKKTIRIGKITFGIILILVGITVFIQTLTNFNILRYVLMFWPLVLISLGIEILIYRNRENIKYDIWSGIFMFVIISIVSIFSIANYGINKVLYDENIQAAILEHASMSELQTVFKDAVNFCKMKDNEKIDIKINEISSTTETKVKIKVFASNKKAKNKFGIIDVNIYDYIFVDNDANEITLLDNFEEYEKIEITVITPNKENIIIK